MSELVLALPVPGQKCIEAKIGSGVYREVIGGESEANLLVLEACRLCDDAGMDVRQDMYYLDSSTLSITPDRMYRKVLECVLDSIGEEALYQIGLEERAPTPEELAAAQKCNAGSEE